MAAPTPPDTGGSSNLFLILLALGEAILGALFAFNRWLLKRVWDTLATKDHVTKEIERYHQLDMTSDEKLVAEKVQPLMQQLKNQDREAGRMHEENRDWMRRLEGKIDRLTERK